MPDKSNICFAEGADTKFALIGLMRHVIPGWPQKDSKDYPVWIEEENEIDQLLKESTLRTEFRRTGLRAMGLVIDAEDNLPSVWGRVRDFAKKELENVPAGIPPDGLVLAHRDGRRLGLWVMPDNTSSGMLEDFLRHMVPDQSDPLWQFSVRAVDTARAQHGARCREAHLPKARLHSWLAFQDPPGERLGHAIARKILNPHATGAQLFIDWFKRLYGL